LRAWCRHASRRGGDDGHEDSIEERSDQPGEPVPAHSDHVLEVHERILGESPARSRHIKVHSGGRVHVIEAGEGPPVLFLHGSSTSSLSVLPLLEHLEGVRMIAVDRPGFGLSEPVHVPASASETLPSSSSMGSWTSWGWRGSRWPAARWVAPGPSGMPSRAPNAFVGSCCPPRGDLAMLTGLYGAGWSDHKRQQGTLVSTGTRSELDNGLPILRPTES
jgi:hypothetical protein